MVSNMKFDSTDTDTRDWNLVSSGVPHGGPGLESGVVLTEGKTGIMQRRRAGLRGRRQRWRD